DNQITPVVKSFDSLIVDVLWERWGESNRSMEPAEDVQGRLLVSPIWRGALNLGSRLRDPRLHELPTIDLNEETRRKERAENDHRYAQLAGSLRVHRADPR